jgi:ABC-type branched-subunit amino acid transport system substrate-binding protein
MVQLRSTWFRRRFVPIMAGTVLVLGVAACSSSSGSSGGGTTGANGATGTCANIPSGPIKIYDIQSLSGPDAQPGDLALNEAQLDVNYFNAHDSVCGHKLSLTFLNDKSDPALGLSEARQIVAGSGSIMIGDSVSVVQNAIQPYLMKNHVLIVVNNGALALANPQANPTFFDAGPSNAQYAQLMVNWAKAHNLNDLGALSDGTSFAVELTADAQADAQAAGLTWVKTITYSPTAIDLNTQLTEAKLSGIKTLLPTGFTGVPAMVSGLKQIGWSPAFVGWGGLADFGVTAAQVPAGTVDGCSVYYPASGDTTTLLTPENTALLNDLKAKIGVIPGIMGISLLGYPALLVIKAAVIKADSLDGAKLAAAVETLQNLPTNVPGFTLSYSPTNHQGMNSAGLQMCTLKQGPYDILYAAS